MSWALMLQGTGSDVGKSLLVAGLCRAYANRGLKVRPFKPQNMSNNAAVTIDGGEIGRAQALQARAARIRATTDMNPVLLKPQSDIGSQVIVQGKIHGNAKARDYQKLKPKLLPAILQSLARLAEDADLVLIEGAGSPAEINLRAADIANMGFAEAADVPVILIGDIDRGGVIAQIVGTHLLLSAAEQNRLKGFIVNKFRGDSSLFDDGRKIISDKTGLNDFGLVPYFADAHKLPAEDAVALENVQSDVKGMLNIEILQLSRIANFDDFDPLQNEPGVTVKFVKPGTAISADADLVILPGSKATLADMDFLRAQGWDIDIVAHHRRGGRILGICGGYQMLGERLEDPGGHEGPARSIKGLGLLAFSTRLSGNKKLVSEQGREITTGLDVSGYHMHLGQCSGPALSRPMLQLPSGPDGVCSRDNRIMGCYLHGLFTADEFRSAFLSRLSGADRQQIAYEKMVEKTLDDLAAHLENHLDLDQILEAADEI